VAVLSVARNVTSYVNAKIIGEDFMENETIPVTASGRSPFKMMGRDLIREYDRLLDSVFHSSNPRGDLSVEVNPRVDMAVTDAAVEVVADLPGVSEKHIKVELRDRILSISGEREQLPKGEGRHVYQHERFAGSFERSVALPCDVEKSSIDATFKDGVLRVILPKTPEARQEITRVRVKH
jgi:HSP20 family protein